MSWLLMVFFQILSVLSDHLSSNKHSTYTCALLQIENLWEVLCPLLRTALSNITIETYADWGTCIATACVRFFFSVYTNHDFILPFVKLVSLILLSLRLCCFCLVQESRDPRKLYWLFEMLMESPVNGEGGSFVDAW